MYLRRPHSRPLLIELVSRRLPLAVVPRPIATGTVHDQRFEYGRTTVWNLLARALIQVFRGGDSRPARVRERADHAGRGD
jgi:hypothetical protein